MPGTNPQQSYAPPEDYIQDNGYSNGLYNGNRAMSLTESSERQMYHRTIEQLERRIGDLEAMIVEYEHRLQRQEDERIEGERRAKKLEEGYEQKVKDYEKKMGDMMLHIRTRDRQFMVVEDKNRRAQRDFQKFHVKKHEIVAQAKREEREAMKRERAALESRQGSTSVGSVSHSSINGSSDGKGDMIRRTPSSGTLLTRAFGGAGSGGARGKPAEGGVSEPPPKQAAQIRTTCFENNLNEFFQIS